MNLHSRILLIALALFCLTCGLAAGQQAPKQACDRVIAANNRFALKFMKASFENSKEENVLLTPAALSYVFGLLNNGASVRGRDELESVFEFRGITPEELNQCNAELKEQWEPISPKHSQKSATEPGPKASLPSLSRFTLRAAMWFPQPFPSREFQAINQTSYGLTIFHRRPTKPAIDAWLSDKTHLKTAGRWAPGHSFAFAVATNFAASWDRPFSIEFTHPGTFRLNDGSTRPIAMMQEDWHFSYLKGAKFQAVVLGLSGTRMYLFLPDEDSNLVDFMDSLNETNWDEWVGAFHDSLGVIELPHFSVQSKQDDKEILQSMGIHNAFSTLAAFAPMVGPEGAMLDGADEFSSLEVDEKGTKIKSALIVTGVIGGICGDCPPPPPPFRMVVDRPFFFAIVDGQTNQILFTSAIVDPASKSGGAIAGAP